MNGEKTKYMIARNIKKEVRDNNNIEMLKWNINVGCGNYEISKHNY